jgi:hypothetical protein
MNNPTKEEIQELKVYVEGVMNGYVCQEQMGNCKICGKWEDLRLGVCWDCGMPICKHDHCPFRKLVYCGQGRKQIFVDLRDFVGYDKSGKVRCDRHEGLCSDREFAIGLDKEPTLPPIELSDDNCFMPKSVREASLKRNKEMSK